MSVWPPVAVRGPFVRFCLLLVLTIFGAFTLQNRDISFTKATAFTRGRASTMWSALRGEVPRSAARTFTSSASFTAPSPLSGCALRHSGAPSAESQHSAGKRAFER